MAARPKVPAVAAASRRVRFLPKDKLEEVLLITPRPKSCGWKLVRATATTPIARCWSSYFSLCGRLYVYGGVCISGRTTVALSDLNYFDYETKNWSTVDQKGEKPEASWAGCATPGPIGEHTAYMIGGRDEHYHVFSTLRKFDADTGTWSVESKREEGKPHPSVCSGTLCCVGRMLLLFGGIETFTDGKNSGAVYTNKLWVYDLDTHEWHEQATSGTVPSARGWHSAVAEPPCAAQASTASIESSGGGAAVAAAAAGVVAGGSSSSTATLGGKLWVFGGAAERAVYNELYWLAVGSWTWTRSSVVGDLPPHSHSMVLLRTDRGDLVMHGGGVPYAHDTANCFYSLESGCELWRWHKGNLGLPPVIYGHCGGYHRGKMYFFGGQDASGKYHNTVYSLEREEDNPESLASPRPAGPSDSSSDLAAPSAAPAASAAAAGGAAPQTEQKEKEKDEPLPAINPRLVAALEQPARPVSTTRKMRVADAAGVRPPSTVPGAEREFDPSPRVLARPSSVVAVARPSAHAHLGVAAIAGVRPASGTKLMPPSTAPTRVKVFEKDVYEVVKQVGRGGFSKIFLVKRKDTGATFAAKKTDLQAATAENRLKAIQEMKVHASLPDHPFVVPFYEAYHHASQYVVIIMRHCDGGDMFTLLQSAASRNERLTEPMVAEWFVELALAVQHLHSNRYLHADLKSANVLLHNGMVQLCDFGMTDHPAEHHKREALKHHKEINGTPDYMAPEQLNYSPPSTATDVWALGIILYEMTTCKLPFAGRSLAEKAERIVKHPYDPLPPDVTPELSTLISLMLSKRPQVRPSIPQILGSPFCAETCQRILQSPAFTASML